MRKLTGGHIVEKCTLTLIRCSRMRGRRGGCQGRGGTAAQAQGSAASPAHPDGGRGIREGSRAPDQVTDCSSHLVRAPDHVLVQERGLGVLVAQQHQHPGLLLVYLYGEEEWHR